MPSSDVLEKTEQATKEIAKHYLQTVKQWNSEEYSLELIRMEGTADAPIAVLEGIYLDDLRLPQRGSGQSVQLKVDARNCKVLQELAYQ